MWCFNMDWFITDGAYLLNLNYINIAFKADFTSVQYFKF